MAVESQLTRVKTLGAGRSPYHSMYFKRRALRAELAADKLGMLKLQKTHFAKLPDRIQFNKQRKW
jgi:hypothetical protein